MTDIFMDDGVRLFVDVVGPGDAPSIVFAHEFGGDWRSWDGLIDALGTRFQCIRYSARGFNPSETPAHPAEYGQARATADLAAIATALDVNGFHLIGCSMGSYTALSFALSEGARLHSLTLIGCSSGPADELARVSYRRDLEREIDLLESKGGKGAVEWFADDDAYLRMPEKAPNLWREYLDRLTSQSVPGALNTLRTVHWDRESLFEQAERLAAISVPTMLLYGDEDHQLVEPTNSFLERTLPNARCVPVHKTGHLVHLEEPAIAVTELERHLNRATET